MDKIATKPTHIVVYLLALAGIVVFGLFAWQGDKGFSLRDEGYLWYGAQRVLLGEVPIRDFMSYDIGRYYWSAILMHMWGDDSIMVLRGSVAVFQVLGLFVGLLLISRLVSDFNKDSFAYLLLSAVTLVVWMFPRHKLFDISLSLFLIGILAYLIDKPTVGRYFITGFCIGLAAIFGRNHGLYGIAAGIGVMVWLHVKQTDQPGFSKKIAFWTFGVIVGFGPVLLMMLFVPGFAAAFWESIRVLLELKGTNLPLPIPWPWRVNFSTENVGDAIRGVLVGFFFIGTIVFGVVSTFGVFYRKFKGHQVPCVVAAASFLALPYAHFAYSRADISHLAQGIFPLLVGCLSYLSTQTSKIKWLSASLLCATSLWVTYVFHPIWKCNTGNGCIEIDISGDRLEVEPTTASDVGLLRKLADKYATEGKSFIAAPFWPGAYSLLDRKSPMWGIYVQLQHPLPNNFQLAEIERIKTAKPGFALIIDLALDGRDELRFRNTHPLVLQYIIDNFEPIPDSPNPAYLIYKAKE